MIGLADLLTHVLVAYVLATVLSWRFEWLSRPLVTAVLVGAVIPDLGHIAGAAIPAETVSATLGVPFSWRPFHLLGGTAAVVAILTLATDRRYARQLLLALALGAGSHYLVDLFKITETGRSWSLFWPLTSTQLPIPAVYVSAEQWPVVVLILLTTLTWVANRAKQSTDDRSSPERVTS